MRIDFVRFSDAAICPTKWSSDAAGFDLYSAKDVLVPPSAIRIIPTDIGFKIPRNYLGKVRLHSSFALRFTDVGGGVIDSDYRGPVSVIFFNFSARSVEIEKGTRFAQIIFQKITNPTLREVEKFTDRTQSDRGSFGSSGLEHQKHVW